MEQFKQRLSNTKIGFIGGGNMAYAIASGLIDAKVIKKIDAVSGPHPEKLHEKWSPLVEIITCDNWKVVQQCNVVFLSVKPHMISQVILELKAHITKFIIQDKVFVSVLAGITKSQIYDLFNMSAPQLRVVRLMPNICVQVREGCCVIAANDPKDDLNDDAGFINYLMQQLGTSEIVPQEQINAFSGLSGSGPAYIFVVIEALADGAVKQGVPRHLALKFAAQTVCGAAKTALVTEKHPAILKDEVCSPGGTTICAIHELEKGGLRGTLISAIEKASERSKQLLPK